MLGTQWVSSEETGATYGELAAAILRSLDEEEPFPTGSPKVTQDWRTNLAQRVLSSCKVVEQEESDILLTGNPLTFFDLAQVSHLFGYSALEGGRDRTDAKVYLEKYAEAQRQHELGHTPKAVQYGACDNCAVVYTWRGKPSRRKAECPDCFELLERATKSRFREYDLRAVKTRREGRTLILTSEPSVTPVTVKQKPVLVKQKPIQGEMNEPPKTEG